MLDAFKVKPFDLEPVYVSWKNPPIFYGKKNEDPVAWLAAIKAGCVERKIPKEHWYQVGRHYLGPKPRERLDELGKVMQKMTGNKHVWNWKKFKIAVQNLGWQSPSSSAPQHNPPPISERPTPKKHGSWWVIGKSDKEDKEDESSTEIVVAKAKPKTASPSASRTPSRSASVCETATPEPGTLTTITSAPSWLVNACQALDFITSEHPKVMSAMSAILITVGAIPALPAVSAGAGGALLASHAVQAAGAIAVGVGQALKAMSEGQVKVDNAPAQASSSKH